MLIKKIKQQQHPFHLVDPSPWPALVSLSLFHLIIFNTSLLNETLDLQEFLTENIFTDVFCPFPEVYFVLYLILFIISIFYWCSNISLEASIRGQHSIEVQNMLRNGFLLFIVSEIMFFFSFFWSFFHLSVSPSIFLGGVWPAMAMDPVIINPVGLPFYNTLILISSGVVVTWFHLHFTKSYLGEYFVIPSILPFVEEDILEDFSSDECEEIRYFFRDKSVFFFLPSSKLKRKLKVCIFSLFLTICLGLFFTSLQLFEYIYALFNISDSVYGSIFYLTTGFHGIHVIIGTLLLGVGLIRLLKNEFTPEHHVGLECAIYYWHFVDVVWLFLYFFLYWWSH